MDHDKGPVSYSRFACVGTGFAGIALGAQLKRWYGISDVRFFERHDDLGGTWFANKYPGCACDVLSALYSFSFEPNPSWTRLLPLHDELWAYLKRVAAKYDLPEKMTFGVKVEKCEWIESTQRWRMHIRHLKTDQIIIHECQFLFGATGQLVEPREPDLPGLENFEGPVFHAARWRTDVDLVDKKVAVFGNGCTGAQIVPAIVKKTKHLTHFTRSKHWILPPIDAKVDPVSRFVFKHVPGTLTLLRFLAYCTMESTLKGFYMDSPGAEWRQKTRASAEKYMREAAPEKYHDILIPDFEVGCKRRVFDPGYLKSLHLDNITLANNPVLEVLPDGIRTKDGVTKTDVIVMANGYSTSQFMPGIEVVGRDGSMAEHWSAYGGPGAYNCTMLSGFPNLFMVFGPNSATGHTSAVMAIENSVNYALRVIKPILDGEAKVVDVKREAEERYVEKMQESLDGTVWNSGCNSWYVDETATGKTWNAHTYPYSQAHFWYDCLLPTWSDYNFTGAAEKKSALRKLMRLVTFTGLVVFGGMSVTLLRKHGLKLLKDSLQRMRRGVSV